MESNALIGNTESTSSGLKRYEIYRKKSTRNIGNFNTIKELLQAVKPSKGLDILKKQHRPFIRWNSYCKEKQKRRKEAKQRTHIWSSWT